VTWIIYLKYCNFWNFVLRHSFVIKRCLYILKKCINGLRKESAYNLLLTLIAKQYKTFEYTQIKNQVRIT